MTQFDKSLVWFRRDLRTHDHAALFHALKSSRQVYCVFVYDTEILEKLPAYDRRVDFIHGSIAELAVEIERLGGALIVRHASAALEIPHLAMELGVDAVFFNHDYEPSAIARDENVRSALHTVGCECRTFKDHVVFEKSEVVSLAGQPYSVFTPYKRAWLKKLHERSDDFFYRPYPVAKYASRFAPLPDGYDRSQPDLESLGFKRTNLLEVGIQPGTSGSAHAIAVFQNKMANYHERRDIPSVPGTSGLSVHLRFGTTSPRELVQLALEIARKPRSAAGADAWLNEIIWRDFYHGWLFHNPHVVDAAFKPAYDKITWESGPGAQQRFDAWCRGETGYPLVDAAMNQLAQTGFMHNRLRMLAASVLVKTLGVDWRLGERFFAIHLNDYDCAANVGGWQWAASSGADAAPYFRIFSPVRQSERFDPAGVFIRKYLPQLEYLPSKFIHAPWLAPQAQLAAAKVTLGKDYPFPIVSHEEARKITLARYEVVKGADAAGESYEPD